MNRAATAPLAVAVLRPRPLALPSATIAAALAIAPTALPQHSPWRDAPPLIALEWHETENGSLGILPNPASGGEPGSPPYPLFGPLLGDDQLLLRRLASALRHPFTGVVLLAPGPGGGLGTTDPFLLLRARGIDTPAAAVALLRSPMPAGNHDKSHLDRYHALAALAELDHRELRQLAEQVAAEPDTPAWLAQAALALAFSRGGPEPPAAATPAPPPLADRLRAIGGEMDLLLVVDVAELPPMAPIGRALRDSELRRTTAEIRDAGGSVSRAMLAGARTLADWPCLLGHELARRYGQWSVRRTVAGVQVGPQRTLFIDAWLDGAFDVARIHEGLRAEAIPCTVDGEVLTTESLPRHRLRVARSWLHLGPAKAGAARAADAAIPAPFDRGQRAAITLRWKAPATWPAGGRLPAPLGFLRPLRGATVRIQCTPTLELVCEVVTPSEAATVHRWLEALPPPPEGGPASLTAARTIRGHRVRYAWSGPATTTTLAEWITAFDRPVKRAAPSARR